MVVHLERSLDVYVFAHFFQLPEPPAGIFEGLVVLNELAEVRRVQLNVVHELVSDELMKVFFAVQNEGKRSEIAVAVPLDHLEV